MTSVSKSEDAGRPLWTPLTLNQLIARLDVKCDEINHYSRPSKGDVTALVGICRRVITAYYEEERDKNDKSKG
jgi:hypothetical protein